MPHLGPVGELAPPAGSAPCRRRRRGATCPPRSAESGRFSSSSSFSSRSGSRSISVSRLYVGTRRANPMVSTSGSKAVAIQPSSASDAPRSSHDRRSRARTSSMSSVAQLRADPPQMPRVDLLQPLPGSGFGQRAEIFAADSSRPSASHCGAAHVGACTPLVIEPIGTSPRVEARPQLVEHVPADPAVQQRHPVGTLRQPQAHVRHVELRRIVLGAERHHAVQRHAGQQRDIAPDGPSVEPRSTASPSPSGTGRCPRAPGCGW